MRHEGSDCKAAPRTSGGLRKAEKSGAQLHSGLESCMHICIYGIISILHIFLSPIDFIYVLLIINFEL